MPLAVAFTTLVIFSVSTSKKGSPFSIVSPSDLNHLLILPSFIVMPHLGTVTFSATLLSPSHIKEQKTLL
jgi:hypothetical protein